MDSIESRAVFDTEYQNFRDFYEDFPGDFYIYIENYFHDFYNLEDFYDQDFHNEFYMHGDARILIHETEEKSMKIIQNAALYVLALNCGIIAYWFVQYKPILNDFRTNHGPKFVCSVKILV